MVMSASEKLPQAYAQALAVRRMGGGTMSLTVRKDSGKTVEALQATGNGMQEINPILLAMLFLFFAGSFAVTGVIFSDILQEVNAERPPEERIKIFFLRSHVFEILGEHAQLFPQSQKRKAIWALAGIGSALLFLAMYFWVLPARN